MSLGAVLSLVSQMINIIVGLVFTPIMIRIMGQNEFGLYQLVLSVVNYLNLMNLGFNGAYIRYYSLAKLKGEKEVSNINGMFFSVFCIIATLCVFAGGVLYQNIQILGEYLTPADYVIAKRLMVYMVLNVAISFPNSLLVAYMFANERFVFYRALMIVTSIVLPALKIPILLLGYGSVGIVVVTFLLTVFRFVVNFIYCRRRLKMEIRYGYFDKTIFGDLLKFTFFIFLSDLVDQLNSNVDKLLLGRMMGTIAVALYSVAFNLRGYYTTMTWIIPEVYIPAVNRAIVEENSIEKANAIFVQIGRINNALTLLVISGFFVFGQTFIRLWVGEEYSVSFYATLMLMISGYIPAVQTMGTNIQGAMNRHQMRSVVYFGIACVNVAASVFLIDRWGVIGTCMGTLFASLLGHGLFMNVYYHKRIRLNIWFFWKEMARWYPAVAVLTAASIWIVGRMEMSGWLDLVLGILAYTCVYFVLILLFGINTEERAFLREKGNAIRKILDRRKEN